MGPQLVGRVLKPSLLLRTPPNLLGSLVQGVSFLPTRNSIEFSFGIWIFKKKPLEFLQIIFFFSFIFSFSKFRDEKRTFQSSRTKTKFNVKFRNENNINIFFFWMSKVNCSQVILFCFVYVAQEFMFFLFSYIKYIYIHPFTQCL